MMNQNEGSKRPSTNVIENPQRGDENDFLQENWEIRKLSEDECKKRRDGCSVNIEQEDSEFVDKNERLRKYIYEKKLDEAEMIVYEAVEKGNLKQLLMCTKASHPTESVMNLAVRDMPIIAALIMDYSVTVHKTGKADAELYEWRETSADVVLDLSCLKYWSKNCTEGTENPEDLFSRADFKEGDYMDIPEYHCVKTMRNLQRKELIGHPLVTMFCYSGWFTYGLFTYVIFVLLSLSIISFFSMLIAVRYTLPHAVETSANNSALKEYLLDYIMINCTVIPEHAWDISKYCLSGAVYSDGYLAVITYFILCIIFIAIFDLWSIAKNVIGQCRHKKVISSVGGSENSVQDSIHILTSNIWNIYQFVSRIYCLVYVAFFVSDFGLSADADSSHNDTLSNIAIIVVLFLCLEFIHRCLPIVGENATLLSNIIKSFISKCVPLLLITVYFSSLILYILLYADMDKFESLIGYFKAFLWALNQPLEDIFVEDVYSSGYVQHNIYVVIYAGLVLYAPVFLTGYIVSSAMEEIYNKVNCHFIVLIDFLIDKSPFEGIYCIARFLFFCLYKCCGVQAARILFICFLTLAFAFAFPTLSAFKNWYYHVIVRVVAFIMLLYVTLSCTKKPSTVVLSSLLLEREARKKRWQEKQWKRKKRAKEKRQDPARVCEKCGTRTVQNMASKNFSYAKN